MRALVRRFKREVRGRDDIVSGSEVTLSDAPERAANTLTAELLLRETFGERIVITRSRQGIVCGSREEAAAERLQEYTEDRDAKDHALLLSSLTAEEIRTYLKDRTGEDYEVFVPDTPEVRFLGGLSEEFGDVKYGL